MTPDIYDIIRTSLSIAPRIIFFLPRSLLLKDLYSILDKILKEKNPEGKFDIIMDVHILNSANKIKALMIIFSNELNDLVFLFIKIYF